MNDLSKLTASAGVVIAASPETLYDMLTDITRMGEWSPVCTASWWDEGAGPTVDSWFTAKNAVPDREFENRSQVVVADRPDEFAWIVGGIDEGHARWGYTFTPVEGGTRVDESWAMVRLTDRTREMTDERAAGLVARGRAGIETTLANLKRVAEASVAPVPMSGS